MASPHRTVKVLQVIQWIYPWVNIQIALKIHSCPVQKWSAIELNGPWFPLENGALQGKWNKQTPINLVTLRNNDCIASCMFYHASSMRYHHNTLSKTKLAMDNHPFIDDVPICSYENHWNIQLVRGFLQCLMTPDGKFRRLSTIVFGARFLQDDPSATAGRWKNCGLTNENLKMLVSKKHNIWWYLMLYQLNSVYHHQSDWRIAMIAVPFRAGCRLIRAINVKCLIFHLQSKKSLKPMHH